MPRTALNRGNALTPHDVALPTPQPIIVLDPMFQGIFGTSVTMRSDDHTTMDDGSDDANRSTACSVKKSGDATVAGRLTVASRIVANGPIIIQPQGDLSMGEFTTRRGPAS